MTPVSSCGAMPFREAANESAMTPGPDRFRAPDGRAIGAYSRAQIIWFYGSATSSPGSDSTASACMQSSFAPHRSDHQIAISLPGPEQQVTGVAMNRGRHDFSDHDRALHSVLRLPLSAALLRARRRQQAGQALATTAGRWLADLTEREIQILRLVADGRTNTAIAHGLEVSPRTVAKHLEHIYRKLGVSSRAAAVSSMTMPQGPVRPVSPGE